MKIELEVYELGYIVEALDQMVDKIIKEIEAGTYDESIDTELLTKLVLKIHRSL